MKLRFRRRTKKVGEGFSDHLHVEAVITEQAMPLPITPPRRATCVHVVSLGVGSFTKDGTVSSFSPRTVLPEKLSLDTTSPSSSGSLTSTENGSLVLLLSREDTVSPAQLPRTPPSPPTDEQKPRRKSSMFLRVADLELSQDSIHDTAHPHSHAPSQHPPPGVNHDPQELWVALDDGVDSYAPIAPYAIEALAQFGLKTAMDETMWSPERKTERLIAAGKCGGWHACVWQSEGELMLPSRGFEEEKEVMVWSGSFLHGLYGSDLPAVRATGLVDMSAQALCELLIDSSRVKEYNKLSLGREDLLVLQDTLHEDGPFGKSVTKVMSSKSKPPLIRKILEFVSILHARELPDGTGYLLVTRAVTQSPDSHVGDATIMQSEILMGVNVLRQVHGDPDRCLMINVNHIRSPMIPMMIARKIGLSAAVNYINDMRAMCKAK